jgi:CitMHS family citrate-Mg2+:H+ or citrate-Ca2+:H+ symporter
MYVHIAVVLGVMVVAYGAASWRKLSVELSMLAAAVAGGLAGACVHTPPAGELARHLVEGTFTYLDVMLVFVTATIFITIVAESGGVDFIVRAIVRAFHRWHLVALFLLMILILIPGALTGAGSVSVLTVGAPSALAMGYLGLSKKRTAAILFIVAGLSAAAPPVNIWAMVICARGSLQTPRPTSRCTSQTPTAPGIRPAYMTGAVLPPISEDTNSRG